MSFIWIFGPQCVTRLEAWSRLSMIVLVLCGMFFHAYLAVTGGNPQLIAFVPAGVACGIWLIARYRGHRMLRRSHFAACKTCRYPLEGLQAAGTCPECGKPYVTAETVEYWTSKYGP